MGVTHQSSNGVGREEITSYQKLNIRKSTA